MFTNLGILDTKLRTLRKSLQNAGADRKTGNVSLALAKDFNVMREAVAREIPELEDALPAALPTTGFGAKMGQSQINYLDLEIMVDQLLAIMEMWRAS